MGLRINFAGKFVATKGRFHRDVSNNMGVKLVQLLSRHPQLLMHFGAADNLNRKSGHVIIFDFRAGDEASKTGNRVFGVPPARDF